MSGKDGDDGFLTRWSRLKRQTEQPAPKVEEPAPVVVAPESEEPFDPDKLEIPLPSLDDLKPGDSLVAFMQKGVPDLIRNAALRKMWALDPMVRDFRSEALDYAWDWNTPGGVPGGGPLGAADKVEEMVQALFRPSIPDPEPHQAQADETLEGEVAATPAPVPAEAPGDDEVQPIEDQSEMVLSEAPAEPLVRRRHGGAMPQV